MKRRDFVMAMGSLPFLAIPGSNSVGKSWEKDGLVDTPEKRLDYTWKLLNELCTDIGPRPTGSVGFEQGARIIKREMERSLPVVEFNRYEFEQWELVGKPECILGRQQRIEILPSFGGEGTPREGITGILQPDGNGFKVVALSTGKAKANITVNRYGRAIPRHQTRTYPPSLPSFGVGKQDVPLLERAVGDQTPVWLKAQVRRVPSAPGLNIVGRIPGKRPEEILFVAHADTVYNSPGANDNTASVIVMLMLAHAIARNKPDHTLTFFASDGEEFGKLGANNYAEKCMADGVMNNIRYVVNFDSLTWGPNLWISSKEDEVKDMIRSIYNDLDINANPRFDNSDGFVMDSEPFRSSGAKAMHVNSRGYNEKTLPVYHRPEDIASNVALDCTEIGFRVFKEFIKRVDKL